MKYIIHPNVDSLPVLRLFKVYIAGHSDICVKRELECLFFVYEEKKIVLCECEVRTCTYIYT